MQGQRMRRGRVKREDSQRRMRSKRVQRLRVYREGAGAGTTQTADARREMLRLAGGAQCFALFHW